MSLINKEYCLQECISQLHQKNSSTGGTPHPVLSLWVDNAAMAVIMFAVIISSKQPSRKTY